MKEIPEDVSLLINEYFKPNQGERIRDFLNMSMIDYKKYFVQIRQEDNSPKIEFSCLNNDFIYDFRYLKGTAKTSIASFKDLCLISVEENLLTFNVKIETTSAMFLHLRATAKKNIISLKEYYKSIAWCYFGGK